MIFTKSWLIDQQVIIFCWFIFNLVLFDYNDHLANWISNNYVCDSISRFVWCLFSTIDGRLVEILWQRWRCKIDCRYSSMDIQMLRKWKCFDGNLLWSHFWRSWFKLFSTTTVQNRLFASNSTDIVRVSVQRSKVKIL